MKLRSRSSFVPALLGILLVLTAAAAEQPLSRKEQLEIEKLELEVAALRAASREWPGWATGVLGIVVGIGGTVATVWVARRTRVAALAQAVHAKRLESYGEIVQTAEPLALYFPQAQTVTPADCKAMGEKLRAWYFEGGGLLMSAESRDAYFRLARALTRASVAAALNVPKFPLDALDISVTLVDQYRLELAALGIDDVDRWSFGNSGAPNTPAGRFKDFVFLQTLSSSLRTALSADLRSRRRPQ